MSIEDRNILNADQIMYGKYPETDLEERGSASSTIAYSEKYELPENSCEKIEEVENTKKGSMKGIMLMLISNMFSMTTQSIVKELYSHNVTPYEFLYLRGTLTVGFNLMYSRCGGLNLLKIERRVLWLLMGRACCGTGCLIFGYISLLYLDISIYTVILYSSPIYTTIIGYFFLAERLSRYDVLGIISGFIGICLIVSNVSSRKEHKLDGAYRYFPYAFGILAALCLSGSYLCVRKIKLMSEGVSVIIFSFYYSFLTSLAGSLHQVFHPDADLKSPGLGIYIYLLMGLAALTGWGAQLTFMQALQTEKAGRSASIKYSQVLFAYLVEIFYFNQKIYFRDVCGAVLIAGSNFTIILLKSMKIIT